MKSSYIPHILDGYKKTTAALMKATTYLYFFMRPLVSHLNISKYFGSIHSRTKI